MLPGGLNTLTEADIARRLAQLSQAPLAGLGMHPGEPAYENLRRAAVLIPLLWDGAQWQVLLTRRTESLQNHKGQVAFPGGASEPEDRSPEVTACREAFEEVGLLPADVQILGRMPARPTISSYLIHPVVGRIPWPYHFQLSPEEVSRAFTIPLTWLADPMHWEEREKLVSTGTLEKVVYFQDYDGETLWGITARIMVDFLKILGQME